ncbi:alkaline-phosphatase-like protein [Blyttiomyces helicus]|uniref:Alkaline-phosphatase-like protein n=1 Tax=Blyttiomyces helicus TaxID=388810 RepID=A0A4P9W364_9FUNG|nr:alkaline-phosphatase-like protein [Blyttiomyces helicus]|eukprot:RKO86739.1 alkaline-phosphatase-like protein [Blyttiomyces helicus]
MKSTFSALTLGAFLLTEPTLAFQLTDPPSHVVIVGIDGLSISALHSAMQDGLAPNMQRLRREGSWSDRARAVLPTVSGPNWYSILAGTGVEMHGVDSNNWVRERPRLLGTDGPCVPQPTLFTLLRVAHPSTTLGAFFEWPMIRTLLEPTSALNTTLLAPDHESIPAAAAFLRTARPELTFVYIGEVDEEGHRSGGGTRQQRAVAVADEQLGVVMAAVETLEKPMLLVVSDHGRDVLGWDHGHVTEGEVNTQFIAWGHNIRANHRIISPLRNMDAAAIALTSLGVHPPLQWTARPVPEIFLSTPLPLALSAPPSTASPHPWIYHPGVPTAQESCVSTFRLDVPVGFLGEARVSWTVTFDRGSFVCGIVAGGLAVPILAMLVVAARKVFGKRVGRWVETMRRRVDGPEYEPLSSPLSGLELGE